jgi:hypothetical protein
VGIGTSSPSVKLHVSGTGELLRLVTTGDVSTTGAVFQRFNDTNGNAAYVGFGGTANEFNILNYKSGAVTFATNNAERMRIDSSGNVIVKNNASDNNYFQIQGSAGELTLYPPRTGADYGRVSTDLGAGLVFETNGATERARITSGGYFKASNSGNYTNASGTYHELLTNATDNNIVLIRNSAASPYGVNIGFTGATPNNTTNTFLTCTDTTNDKCIIYSSGTISNRTGTYNAISDLKLKQDIVDANSQWDDIKALRVVKYRLKDEVAEDPNYPAYIGLVAQEVEQVSAGLVDDCPDFENVEVPVLDDEGNPVLDDEGNPQVTTERQATGTVTKSVKYSILYMKAVKALQEAMERIETLEAKVAALENA